MRMSHSLPWIRHSCPDVVGKLAGRLCHELCKELKWQSVDSFPGAFSLGISIAFYRKVRESPVLANNRFCDWARTNRRDEEE